MIRRDFFKTAVAACLAPMCPVPSVEEPVVCRIMSDVSLRPKRHACWTEVVTKLMNGDGLLPPGEMLESDK